MEGLFKLLWDRVHSNARRAVDVYVSELPDFRSVAEDARARASMLDFAMLAAFGEERGAQGISLSSRRRVLDLHDVLTLREIHEAAGLNEIDHVTEMIGWLPVNALAGHNAYNQGFPERAAALATLR